MYIFSFTDIQIDIRDLCVAVWLSDSALVLINVDVACHTPSLLR